MRITIVAVGRDRGGPAQALFDTYVDRCPWHVRLVEIPPLTTTPLARRLAEEAERLLRAAPQDAIVIALDERGTALDSAAFAARIADWRDQGRRDLALLIGGPDGLAPTVRERAALILSLGVMTWPHRLVRVLVAEQLYRASTILAGHPYHRE